MPEGTNDVLGSTKAGFGPAFVGRKGSDGTLLAQDLALHQMWFRNCFYFFLEESLMKVKT